MTLPKTRQYPIDSASEWLYDFRLKWEGCQGVLEKKKVYLDFQCSLNTVVEFLFTYISA